MMNPNNITANTVNTRESDDEGGFPSDERELESISNGLLEYNQLLLKRFEMLHRSVENRRNAEGSAQDLLNKKASKI
jgi:hypothetical protein